jgi:F0F1-type ATP synthase epsilon subunit
VLTLQIVTPEKAFPTVECDHVTFVAVDGQVGVRTGRAALVGQLATGFVQAKRNGKALPAVAIRGGVGQVSKDKVLILTEQAVGTESVDRTKAETRLAAIAEDPAAATERAFLKAQLALPKHDVLATEHLSGARAAIDAAKDH